MKRYIHQKLPLLINSHVPPEDRNRYKEYCTAQMINLSALSLSHVPLEALSRSNRFFRTSPPNHPKAMAAGTTAMATTA